MNYQHPSSLSPEFNIKNPKSESKTKYPFEREAEALVVKELDAIDFKADHAAHPFESVEARKSRLKSEILEEAQLPELYNQLNLACEILAKSSRDYLDDEKFVELTNQFASIGEIAESLNIETLSNQNLMTIFKFDSSVMESISKIAVAKYKEGDYAACLALFALLSALNPNNDEYWYRLGIAAQKAGNFDLALKAYNAALEIDPNLLGAKLFSVECYIKGNDKKKAKVIFTEAKKLAEAVGVTPEFKELIFQTEQMLGAA